MRTRSARGTSARLSPSSGGWLRLRTVSAAHLRRRKTRVRGRAGPGRCTTATPYPITGCAGWRPSVPEGFGCEDLCWEDVWMLREQNRKLCVLVLEVLPTEQSRAEWQVGCMTVRRAMSALHQGPRTLALQTKLPSTRPRSSFTEPT